MNPYKIILTFLFIFTLSPVFSSYGAGPQSLVESLIEHGKNPALEKDKNLQKQVATVIDFDQLTAATLKNYQKKITSADMAWYQTNLTSVITKTVYPKAADFLKDISITLKEELKGPLTAEVLSSWMKKGERTQVRYFMTKKNEQSPWKIIDVAIDGDRWSQTIEDEMSDIMDVQGFAGVKKKITKKLADLTKSNKSNKTEKTTKTTKN